MASSLYVNIRGDYTQFQKDMNELRGIARKSAVAVSEAFEHAFSPKLFKSGLQQVGLAIKSLNASASKMGTVFEPTIARLGDLAKACSVSEKHMQSLVNRMAEAAHQRQLENSLRTLQRQLNLTNSELAKMQREAGDTAGSVNTSLKSIGVRSTAALRNEIIEVANAFSQIELSARTTKENTQRYLEAMREKTHQLRREMMTATERKRDDYNQLVSKYTTAAPTTKGFEAYSQMVKLKEAMSSFQEVNGRLPRTVAEMRQLGQATGATLVQVRKLRDSLIQSSGFFNTIIESVKQKVFFGLGAGMVDSIRTAMRLENVEVAFTAIYGTAEMASKKLAYVRQVSDELGLSFMDTAEGAKKLFAAAQGTPVEREANMVFKAFSNMSSALKLTGDETKGVFLALSQMISKGKVSAEELRQQLAERMPGAVNLFARSIGKSTQELDKMLQKGEVNLTHFVQFAKEVNRTYEAGAREAGNSLQGELNRIENTWVDFKRQMVDTGAFASAISTMNSMLKGLLPVIAELSKYSSELAVGGIAAWAGSSLVAGGKLNAVLSATVGAIKKFPSAVAKLTKVNIAAAASAVTFSGALNGLKGALLAIPAHPALAVAIGAIVGLMGLAIYRANKMSKAFSDVNKTMSERIAEREKSAAAEEESRFDPAAVRASVIDDTQKAYAKWNVDYADAVEKLRRDRANERASVEEYSNTLGSSDNDVERAWIRQEQAIQNTRKAVEGYNEALNKAFEKKDAGAISDMMAKAALDWKLLKQEMQNAHVDSGIIEAFDRMFGRLDENMSKSFVNVSKWANSFSAETANAAKRIGLDVAQIDKEFGKIRQAAEKTDLGKAFVSLQDMDRVRKALGDMSMEYDKGVAATANYVEKLQNHVNELHNSSVEYDKHVKVLEVMRDAYNVLGEGSLEELSAKEKEIQGENDLLNSSFEKLADRTVSLAMAAGGTDAQFNIMIAALEKAQEAGLITEEALRKVIDRVRELQGAAQQAAAAARGMAIIDSATKKLTDTQLRIEYKKNNKKNYIEIRKFQDGAQAASDDVYAQEYDLLKYNDKLGETLKSGKGGKRGGGGGKRVDNTQEKYHSAEEGWRKKIADMQGQKDVQTLAKDFADMDKQLKGSSVDMKALKKDYLEAFSTKYANDLNKEILQLRGNEAELARIDIEEKYKAKAAAIEGMAEEAKKLGVTVADQTPKLAEYRKLLEGQAREQQLEKELPYYEKFSWFDGMKSEALAKQNELIAIQAEKMRGTIPDELIERWKELEELQNRVKNGNDVLAGIALGAKQYALEMGNMAENVSDLVKKSFDDMADAFTDLVMTGKANFTDLANSIIRDLMRIAIKQAIIGPIANGIGSLFGGLFNIGGGASSAVSSAVSAGARVLGSAHGNVFTGLHGYSNQIVDRPTLFSYGSQLTKFAKGGIMGEAGPEAVMPLTRTASGHLGVRSDSGNAPIVNVNIINSTGQSASQQTKTDNQGNKSIDVMVGDMAAGQMMKQGSSLNKAMRAFTGQQQQVTRR